MGRTTPSSGTSLPYYFLKESAPKFLATDEGNLIVALVKVLLAFSAEDGHRLWSFDSANYQWMSLTAGNKGAAFLASSTALYKVDT